MRLFFLPLLAVILLTVNICVKDMASGCMYVPTSGGTWEYKTFRDLADEEINDTAATPSPRGTLDNLFWQDFGDTVPTSLKNKLHNTDDVLAMTWKLTVALKLQVLREHRLETRRTNVIKDALDGIDAKLFTEVKPIALALRAHYEADTMPREQTQWIDEIARDEVGTWGRKVKNNWWQSKAPELHEIPYWEGNSRTKGCFEHLSPAGDDQVLHVSFQLCGGLVEADLLFDQNSDVITRQLATWRDMTERDRDGHYYNAGPRYGVSGLRYGYREHSSYPSYVTPMTAADYTGWKKENTDPDTGDLRDASDLWIMDAYYHHMLITRRELELEREIWRLDDTEKNLESLLIGRHHYNQRWRDRRDAWRTKLLSSLKFFVDKESEEYYNFWDRKVKEAKNRGRVALDKDMLMAASLAAGESSDLEEEETPITDKIDKMVNKAASEIQAEAEENARLIKKLIDDTENIERTSQGLNGILEEMTKNVAEMERQLLDLQTNEEKIRLAKIMMNAQARERQPTTRELLRRLMTTPEGKKHDPLGVKALRLEIAFKTLYGYDVWSEIPSDEELGLVDHTKKVEEEVVPDTGDAEPGDDGTREEL